MTSKFAYKTRGSDTYQSHVTQGLSQPTNSCVEPTFFLPVGNFGLPAMKESSRTTLDPNTVFYTHRCKQLQNTTSLLAPLVNLQAASLILLDGIPPPHFHTSNSTPIDVLQETLGQRGQEGCCETTGANGYLTSHSMGALQQIIWLNWLRSGKAWKWPGIRVTSSYILNQIPKWFFLG